jgi:ABC-type transporter Mla MlaB component
MLIITRSEGSDLTRTLKLEGKLFEPWIGELESACGEARSTPDRVCLDLCDLTYIDAAGARFLTSLIRDGARVIACSRFVAEMLHLNGR